MKKKYEVNFYFTSSASYTVNAETPEEALEIARGVVSEFTRDNVASNQIMRNLDEDESATEIVKL